MGPWASFSDAAYFQVNHQPSGFLFFLFFFLFFSFFILPFFFFLVIGSVC